ncbi:gamma-tubulin complex component 5-like isoform X2 [Bacillus rossius redtenbacheri]|uniref:gamma-tubulin complex component 5-like isoform X2 n=1 Tax=Bacillus rossius redtenbacheri TaxID=93214 RepID=UPI002FDE06EE
MAVKLSDDVLDDVRGLIKEVTRFTEEDENFNLCYKYAVSNIYNHRYLSVNRHVVKQSLADLALRFRVQGHAASARRLDQLVSDFVDHPVFKEHPQSDVRCCVVQSDVQWSVLSVLVSLAHGPADPPPPAAVREPEEQFDWGAYLREGEPDVHYYSSDSDTEDDWTSPGAEEAPEEAPEASEQRPRPRTDARSDQILQGLLAREWLAGSVQRGWWSSLRVCEPDCGRPGAASLWNKHGAPAAQVNTLSEHKVVREVLFMLREPTDMCVFARVGDKYCVRPGVTVPSLTQGAFSGMLQELCGNLDVLRELADCAESLRSGAGRPPLTCRAFYCLAVDTHVARLREAVCALEADVRRQEKPHTLLSVKEKLRPLLDDLRLVHDLHRRAAVVPWGSSPNWLSAACMLSVIYEALETAVDDHVASMMLSIFMKVFSPYLRIANTWLTGGQLEDDTQEFIITRSDRASEGLEVRPLEAALLQRGVRPAPVLRLFARRVLQAGGTMDFLHRLNRVSEVTGQSQPCGELFVKLSADSSMLTVALIDKIVAAVTHVETGRAADERESEAGDDSEPLPEQSPYGFTHLDFPKHMRQLGDPYLLAAFGYLFDEDSQTGASLHMHSYKMEDSAETTAFKRLDGLALGAALPLRQLLQGQLGALVAECHAAACGVVRRLLLQELLLPAHFSAVRHVVLGQAGDVLHDFATGLFSQVEQGALNAYVLSHSLQNCAEERFPEHGWRFAVQERADEQACADLRTSVLQLKASALRPVLQRAVSAMALISTVHVLYKVDWPVSLFLNDVNMKLYNKVFQFLLQVKWALHSLNHLRFTDLRGPERGARRLQLLRFWHTHTLGSVHAYLLGQVLQSESLQLQRALDTARDLHGFLAAHDNYVKTIYRKCFCPRKLDFIVCGVHQLVAQAYVLKACWGERAAPGVLDCLEAMYNQTHCTLTIVLRLHVQGDFHSERECPASRLSVV